MKGNEGKQWAWCAGFVSTVIRQASGASDPLEWIAKDTFSCDRMAEDAEKAGQLLRAVKPSEIHDVVQPGDFFLVVSSKNNRDWRHVGIVVDIDDSGAVITTIEGNTNDEGSREGYEVALRHRAVGKLDFIQNGDRANPILA